jgi:hypothetical protein
MTYLPEARVFFDCLATNTVVPTAAAVAAKATITQQIGSYQLCPC